MAIPTYDKFYRALLEVLSDGEVHNTKETLEYCENAFHLSGKDKEAMLQSGRQTILANRVGWARTYLKKAGLINAPSRGHYQITSEGKKALENDALIIDNEYLSKFKGFQNFVKTADQKILADSGKTHESEVKETPLEVMENAYNGIVAQLADNLMTNIMDQSPAFFEHLVIDLLMKMGYGGTLISPGEVTGKSGDEGIDGIIREDALGFDKIYVQAKRWADDHVVGEPDIHQFAGALMGKGATKGLFITTSHFSRQAVNFVDKHMTAKIVLVDGEALTRLMIRYGLGVSTIHTYDIKRIDSDYFSEENE